MWGKNSYKEKSISFSVGISCLFLFCWAMFKFTGTFSFGSFPKLLYNCIKKYSELDTFIQIMRQTWSLK